MLISQILSGYCTSRSFEKPCAECLRHIALESMVPDHLFLSIFQLIKFSIAFQSILFYYCLISFCSLPHLAIKMNWQKHSSWLWKVAFCQVLCLILVSKLYSFLWSSTKHFYQAHCHPCLIYSGPLYQVQETLVTPKSRLLPMEVSTTGACAFLSISMNHFKIVHIDGFLTSLRLCLFNIS